MTGHLRSPRASISEVGAGRWWDSARSETDGALLGSELGGPTYVREARKWLDDAAAETGQPKRLTAYVRYAGGHDSRATKQEFRPRLGHLLWSIARNPGVFEIYGIEDQLQWLAKDGPDRVTRDMPDVWLDELAVVGDAEECAFKIKRLQEAGADSVVLIPEPPTKARTLIAFAGKEITPLL